jgi:hypothetical protein
MATRGEQDAEKGSLTVSASSFVYRRDRCHSSCDVKVDGKIKLMKKQRRSKERRRGDKFTLLTPEMAEFEQTPGEDISPLPFLHFTFPSVLLYSTDVCLVNLNSINPLLQ